MTKALYRSCIVIIQMRMVNFYYLAFFFRTELTFHVRGFLPNASGETIFADPGEQTCAALNEPDTLEKPHCRITLANILVTNHIKTVPASGYRENSEMYGYLSYKAIHDIEEFTGESGTFDQKKKGQLIPPGATRAYPVSLAHAAHGISVRVRLYENLKELSELCISSWLPKAHMLVKYGASPQIIISGEVGYDGNLKQDFECEMRCNEKDGQRDCWDVSVGDMFGWYFTRGKRPDLLSGSFNQ